MRIHFPQMFLAGFLSLVFVPLTQALTLIADGESPYRIAVATDANETERFAAEELSRYLAMISDVELPIVSAAETVAGDHQMILIGHAAPAAVLAELTDHAEDDFLIQISGERVILTGASPRATLYAVYAFLESLGVGFPRPGQSYLIHQVEEPGPQEETVPRLKVIELEDIHQLESPSFSYRAIVIFPMVKDRAMREIDWMAKNRLNWVHLITNTELSEWEKQEVADVLLPAIRKRGMELQCIGHSFFAYIPPEQYAETNPEYFAMGPDGKRQIQAGRGGLCVSNPDVVRVMAENMDRFLSENPEIKIIDLWTNDSSVWCHCPDCKKMQGLDPDAESYDSTTRAYLKFVNQVAERLADKYPELRINALAYATNFMPAVDVAPAANVIVGLAPWQRTTYMSSDDYYVPLTQPSRVNDEIHDALLGWLDQTSNLYLYDYYGNRSEFFPIIDTLRKDYAYYQTIGLDKLSSECFLWPEFNMWAYGRLAWNHQIPLRQLVEDFCRIAYRGAQQPMSEFYLALEGYKWEWPQHQAELAALLEQAQTKAGDDPTVQAKLERLHVLLATTPNKSWEHPQPPPPLSE